jgi:DNA-directed RNA polymerase subunit L
MNNPMLTKIIENDTKLYFTLSGIDKCFANALRRTILTDIPTIVIRTENNQVNQCVIKKNTSRLHNEIIQQRISCIPIHVFEPDFVGKHTLEIDVINDSDEQTIRMVTTKDIKIKDINSNLYLSEEETKKIFPPNEITGHYIDIVRLRPKIGLSIPGEQITLSAKFSVASARIDSMFNVVSVCSYGFTIDKERADEAWDKIHQRLKTEDKTKSEIDHIKSDFWNLDAQRYFIQNSFDFVVQSVGVYKNIDIVHKACSIICSKIDSFVSLLEENNIPILESNDVKKHGYDSIIESTIENSYDIILDNEDDTLGNILSLMLYQKYFIGKEKEITYCSFKKFHPHDTYGVLRIAYEKPTEKSLIHIHLKTIIKESKLIIEEIRKFMKL